MHKGPKIEKKGEKLGHFRVPKPSLSKWEKVHNLSCENEFYLHENENHLHIKGCALNLVLIQRPGKLGNGLQSSPDSFPVISESPINGHLKMSTSTTSTRFSYSLIPSNARPWTSRREARKYQELTFGFPCTEQPLVRTRTRQKPLRRKWKVKKLALVWNQVVGLASTDKTNWRINLRFWEIVHLPLP